MTLTDKDPESGNDLDRDIADAAATQQRIGIFGGGPCQAVGDIDETDVEEDAEAGHHQGFGDRIDPQLRDPERGLHADEQVVPGDIDLGGDFTLREAAGTVEATVIDGDVHVEDPDNLCSLQITDGHVTADLSALQGDASVETTDGDIVVRLAPDLNVQIEASTIDGAVTGD